VGLGKAQGLVFSDRSSEQSAKAEKPSAEHTFTNVKYSVIYFTWKFSVEKRGDLV